MAVLETGRGERLVGTSELVEDQNSVMAVMAVPSRSSSISLRQ